MADGMEQPKNNSKMLMIVLLVLVLILIIGVAVGGYFIYSQGAMNNNQSSQTTAQSEESNSKQFYKTGINDLVLNITNSKGREKLMKLSFTIKSNDANIEAIIEENKAEIIDVVIAQISARNSEELLTVGGKALLKEELLEEINKVLNEVTNTNEEVGRDLVKKIYFTTFVIK